MNRLALTSYKLLEPPSSPRDRTLTKAGLTAFARWFHTVRPHRIADLATVVHATPGFEGWSADRSPCSLDPLGVWFASCVTLVPWTRDEFQREINKLAIDIELDRHRLSDETISLSYDVGMYLGEVVVRHISGTGWTQILSGRSNMDYGYPVIAGFGKAQMNPVRVAMSMAYRAIDSRAEGARLREVYDAWKKAAESC